MLTKTKEQFTWNFQLIYWDMFKRKHLFCCLNYSLKTQFVLILDIWKPRLLSLSLQLQAEFRLHWENNSKMTWLTTSFSSNSHLNQQMTELVKHLHFYFISVLSKIITARRHFTRRRCFATTATTPWPATGTCFATITPTASSATRTCSPTTATSAAKSSASIQR